MSGKRWFTSAFAAGLLCMVGFVLIAYWISDHQIHVFDDKVIGWVQGMESPGLTVVMKSFSWIGSGIPVAVITLAAIVILYFVLKHRSELVFLAALAISSSLINSIIKAIFRRDRPTLHRIAEANGFSFPSGHAMATIALYGGLAFLLWKHAPKLIGRILIILISLVFIIGIGISRIYLGVHYPSDVLGGYLLTGALLAIFIWYYQGYLELRGKKRP
ncbi:phosphatase PAP2 family protein [Paenibacillus sp. J22TS3]|uniref:phosphatase PAP2 family protein n=1 Tax=Paenibacillus sp. J22TS3 TaxID=2807192 RepID=UPI001B11247D|nr:phosphatase PAP2 family protein [Paenibacillus sp. J22TS3]GIP23929.1 phosphatase PAP2 family protein [Paenibacillus sp. J22TS3]